MKANHNLRYEMEFKPKTISNISKILNESKSQLTKRYLLRWTDYFQYFKDTK